MVRGFDKDEFKGDFEGDFEREFEYEFDLGLWRLKGYIAEKG